MDTVPPLVILNLKHERVNGPLNLQPINEHIFGHCRLPPQIFCCKVVVLLRYTKTRNGHVSVTLYAKRFLFPKVSTLSSQHALPGSNNFETTRPKRTQTSEPTISPAEQHHLMTFRMQGRAEIPSTTRFRSFWDGPGSHPTPPKRGHRRPGKPPAGPEKRPKRSPRRRSPLHRVVHGVVTKG